MTRSAYIPWNLSEEKARADAEFALLLSKDETASQFEEDAEARSEYLNKAEAEIFRLRQKKAPAGAERFLSRPEVARLLGVRRETLNSRVKMPDPDVYIGTLPGWREETIREWDAQRPSRVRARQKEKNGEAPAG